MTSFIVNAFACAYIRPETVAPAYNPRSTVPFDLNLTDLELQTGAGWDDSQDILSTPAYWAALLVSVYQPGGNGDQDSDAFLGDNNNQWGINPQPDPFLDVGATVEDSQNASVVFIEVIRDIGAQAGKDFDHTIAHELGHSAGNNTPASQDHAELGIMSEGAPDSEAAFSPATLKRFRECNPW